MQRKRPRVRLGAELRRLAHCVAGAKTLRRQLAGNMMEVSKQLYDDSSVAQTEAFALCASGVSQY